MAGNNRVDIKRTRSLISEASSSAISYSGSHGRRRFPEKLVDKSRGVSGRGVANVDNGASITIGLANVVSMKACQLEMRLKNTLTGQLSPCWGQAGLIQAERLLTASPLPENPRKRRQALVGTNPERTTVEVASRLRSSPRFAVIPITCIHNLEDDVDVPQAGVTWEFVRSELMAVSANAMYEVNFEKARYTPFAEIDSSFLSHHCGCSWLGAKQNIYYSIQSHNIEYKSDGAGPSV